MSSEVNTVAMQDKCIEVETLASRSRKKTRGKVPKRVHKAEREKMKREHFNDLFLELANSLELSEQQNGKASVLTDAIRMIKDMVSQIESLRKENAALTSEAEDVTSEKTEFQDENLVLGSQISELRNALEKRIHESQIDLNAATAPIGMQYHELASHSLNGPFQHPGMESTMQAQNANAFYVIPLCSAPGIYPDPSIVQNPNNVEPIVCKPKARYSCPGDAWPSQILEKHAESGCER